ncbi:LacI family transcriptional regulator [Mucilaginibacter sp. PPCGB 2223]|uniref:LacI family DNA-binding transcriptional regulator n=1 Tax=Mucilaginibacter sp. PPCGB 2223 TaxID=1886027 RepID=UPI000824E01D|nr:LacI family DNA-binding transcriptional regulator [Mucilaginibacter sp. PPCGB 2223]OCX52252.1 LacI family transcriptional regulator [Mucilaginibacter sp. PPCGB 2223]
MKKKLSIKDVAEQLNVSKTTVSFVLNGKAEENGISKAVQKKVLKHIEKVGYRPNRMAQGLRTGKSKTIGMLIEDISDAFFSSIARKFEEIFGQKGYRIIYGSTGNDTQVTKDLIQVFRNHQVDGFIIAPSPGIEKDIEELLQDHIPVVIFDRPTEDMDINCVLVDNFMGTCKAMQHLADNKYTNTAMITLTSEQSQMKERERGYRSCMANTGVEPSIMKVKYHEQKEKAITDIEQFLKNNPKIDSVFFTTNYLAEAGLEAITNLGLTIPGQLGIVVFDDANLFRLFKPPITAVSQPIERICDQAVLLLFEQMEGKEATGPKVIQLPTTLHVRNSTIRQE